MTLISGNNVFNIALLQNKLDEIIFDYIDSKPNWEKASKYLEEMLEESSSYFVNYVKEKEEVPSATTFWVIFTSLHAKLIYFSTLALKNCEQKSLGITDEVLAKRFEVAASCMTDHHADDAEQFWAEMEASYKEVSNDGSLQPYKNLSLDERIMKLYAFCANY